MYKIRKEYTNAESQKKKKIGSDQLMKIRDMLTLPLKVERV